MSEFTEHRDGTEDLVLSKGDVTVDFNSLLCFALGTEHDVVRANINFFELCLLLYLPESIHGVHNSIARKAKLGQKAVFESI